MSQHWAERYLGKAWRSGADGPDAYDCHGVVRAVYLDRAALCLPVVPVNALSPLAVRHAMRDYDYSDWETLPAPTRELDVVEMSLASRPHHVGVYLEVDGGGVLTSVEGAGVVFQSLASLKRHGWNIVACYRKRENDPHARKTGSLPPAGAHASLGAARQETV